MRFSALIVSGVVMVSSISLAGPPAAVVESAQGAMSKVKSIAYEITLVRTPVGGVSERFTGEVMMKKAADDRGVPWKIYVGGNVGSDAGAKRHVYVAYDGVAARSTREEEKIIYERNATDLESLGEFFEKQGVKDALVWSMVSGEVVGASGKVEGEGTRKVGNEPCDVVRLVGEAGSTRLYLAASDHLPRRIEVLGAEETKGKDKSPGAVVSTLELTNIRVDVPIAENSFVVDVPDGFMVKAVRGASDLKKKEAQKKQAGGEDASKDTKHGPVAPGLLAEGTPAPLWTLKDGDGAMVNLSDFAGKVVVLDFWGSWCPPCRAAMPTFQKIHEAYKDRGVVVIGANFEHDAAADPKAFMAKNGITYRLVRGAETIANWYKVPGWPTYYVIDRHGEVVYGGVGFNGAEADQHYKEISEAVEKALGEGV